MVKKYHAPATPYEQLLADNRVEPGIKQRLQEQFASLDPLELLNHLRRAQEEIARLEAGSDAEPLPAVLALDHFVRSLETAWRSGEVRAPYKKRRSDAKPHTWRTRPDPYEEVWPILQQWLNEEPHAAAKSLFQRLNTEMPNRFKPGQVSNSSTAGQRMADGYCETTGSRLQLRNRLRGSSLRDRC